MINLKKLPSIICVLAVLAMLCGLYPVFAEGDIVYAKQTLFQEDFTGDFTAWSMEDGGGFRLDTASQALQFESVTDQNRAGIITAGSADWNSYEFSAELVPRGGGYIGLLFRYQDRDNHYLLQFYQNSGKVILLKKVSGGEYSRVKEAGYSLTQNAAQKVLVKLDGKEITVFADEKQILSAEDTSIAAGKIGFRGQNTRFSVNEALVVGEYIDEEKSNVFSYIKDPKRIYVSPDGDDTGDGSISRPLKTLSAAKNMANVKKIGQNPVEVIFRAGSYEITDTVSYTSADSGSVGAPIIYKAADGEKVVFTGAKSVNVGSFRDITDKAVLKRLSPKVAGKVKQLDLKALGIEKEMVDLDTNRIEGGSGIPVGVYLNDYRQSVSKWPNTSYNKFMEGGIVQAGGVRRWGNGPDNGAVFKYSELNPSKWGDVSNSYLVGYFGAEFWGEWAKMKSVDPEQNTISLSRWTQYGVKEGYRWSVMHLLEEIDIPGEWYIDYDKMTMYYYVPYELDPEKDVFEITELTKNFLSMMDTKYVAFQNVTFEKNRGGGVELSGTKNVTFDGCTFANIGTKAMLVNATYTNLTNNDFYWCGGGGIFFNGGGDKATLTSGHNVVTNNHLYYTQRDGLDSTGSHFGAENGNVGMKISHNLMHRSGAAMAGARGNEHEFSYNELWNASRDTSDSTAVGLGRSWTDYRNYFLYNFIHDVGSPTFKGFYTVNGLFWDDTQSGQVAKYNIINMNNKNNTAGIRQGGGRDNVVEDNIILNSDISINGEDRTGSLDITTYDAYKLFVDCGIDFTKEPWNSRYPEVQTILGDIEKDGRFIPRNDVIANNVFANTNKATISSAVSGYGRVENNLETEDMSIFVDPAKQDFRITHEAKAKYNLSAGLPGEDFDLDLIGLQREVTIPKTDFQLLYPENGATGMEKRALELFWEDALLADEYRYVIATDPECTQIVSEGITLNPYLQPEGIENGKTYYWKIFARYTSKKNPAEWESTTGTGSFTMAATDSIEKEFLQKSVTSLKKLQGTMTESTAVGGYEVGTKAKIQQLISRSEALLANSAAAQDEVNAVTLQNNNFVNTLGAYVNVGYRSLKIGKAEEWEYTPGSKSVLSVESNHLKINKIASGAEYLLRNEKLPTNEILCFDAKSDLKGWIGFSARQSDKAVGYSHESNEYMVVVKKDVFELQQYRKDQSVLGILTTAPNNGIYKADQWNQIQMGVVDLDGGVEIIFTVNGQKVFDYFDTKAPIYEAGYFVLTYYEADSYVELQEASEVPSGLYEKPEIRYEEIFSVDSEQYEEDENWKAADTTGYNGLKNHSASQQGAKASWLLPGDGTKTYKVYFWNEPALNTDPEVKIHFKNYDVEETKTMNMSEQPQGWVEIGEYVFITAQASEGELDVEFETSGNGEFSVSAMKTEQVKK